MATNPLTKAIERLRLTLGQNEDTALPDAQLLSDFIERHDEASFAVLVRRHGPLVMGVCQRITRNRHDAEDTFQATFLILVRKAASIARRESLANWLYSVAFKAALKMQTATAKRRSRERQVSEMPEREAPEGSPWTDLLPLLDRELSRLPKKYRLPVILCDLEGKTQKQAAQLLGCPEKTLVTRLSRARAMLAKRLTRHGLTLSAGALATALAQSAASAKVAPGLVSATVKAASAFATGVGPASGVISIKVVALAEGVLRGMVVSKAKLVLIVLMGLGLAVGGVGFAGKGSQPTPKEQQAVATVAVSEQGKEPEAGRDLFNDLLPAGATARFGTVRWRHGGLVTFAAFLPDGNTVLTAADDTTIRVWEYPSGKEIRRIGKPVADPWDDLRNRNVGKHNSFWVALSKDSKTIAVNLNTAIKLHDVASGRVLHEFKLPDEPEIAKMALSPDGSQIAALHWGTIIRLWDVATGKEVRRLATAIPKGASHFLGVVYSPDGKTLATSVAVDTANGRHYGITAWNLGTGDVLWTKVVTQISALSLPVFSPDSKAMAVAGNDGTIRVLQTLDGKEVCKLVEGPPKALKSPHVAPVVFSPTGDKLYSHSFLESAILEWDLKSAKLIRKLVIASAQGASSLHTTYHGPNLVLSPDGKVLVLTQRSHAPEFLDLETGKAIAGLNAGAEAIVDVHFTADGKHLLTHAANGAAYKWDKRSGKAEGALPVPKQSTFSTISANGKVAAVFLAGFRGATFWNVPSDKELAKIAAPANDEYADIIFSPDEKTVALRWQREQKIDLYDLGTCKRLLSWTISTGWDSNTGLTEGSRIATGTMIFSPDGKILAAYADPKTFVFWDVATGKRRGTLVPPDDVTIVDGAFSLDGRCLAVKMGEQVGATDERPERPVAVYELASGSMRRTFSEKLAAGKGPLEVYRFISFKVYTLPGRQVAISPDGKTLAHATRGGDLQILDILTSKQMRVLAGHSGVIRSLAFSPDSKAIASASGDTTALLWDIANLDRPVPTMQAVNPDAVWLTLTGSDAVKAGDVIYTLSAFPKDAVKMLKEKLRPAPPLDLAHVEKLISQLDDGQFKVRQAASLELLKIGERVVPPIEKALAAKRPLETQRRLEELYAKLSGHVLQGEALGVYRAIEVLERIGSPEAKAVLETLAKGAPGARETEEAKASLERLTARASAGK